MSKIIILILAGVMFTTIVSANDDKPCITNETGVVVYRNNWTTNVTNREPINRVDMLDQKRKKIFYFMEILGGDDRKISVHWYKNNQFKAKIKFNVGSDRWRTWSSKNLHSRLGDKWSIKLYDKTGCLLLYDEVKVGNKDVVDKTIASGWMKTGDAISALIMEKNDKNISTLEYILKKGGNEYLDERNEWGDTPLLLALRMKNIAAVKLLLESGAKPHVWDYEGNSALDIARNKSDKRFEKLIEHKLDTMVPSWAVLNSFLTSNVQGGKAIDVVYRIDKSKKLYFILDLIGSRNQKVIFKWFYKGKILKHKETVKVESDIWPTFSTYTIPADIEGQWVVFAMDESGRNLASKYFDYDKKPSIATKTIPVENYRIPISTLKQFVSASAPVIHMGYFMKNMGTLDRQDRIQLEKIIVHSVEIGNISALKYLSLYSRPLHKIKNINGLNLVGVAEKNSRNVMSYYLKKIAKNYNGDTH